MPFRFLIFCLILLVAFGCCSGQSRSGFGCNTGNFKCANGNSCIPSAWVCDGEDDCTDRSDEQGCTQRVCSSKHGHFRCDGGRCIRIDWHCDGEKDCRDGSDEKSCSVKNTTCAAGKFSCGDGTCIPKSWVCDHDTDCIGGSDEKNCNMTTCAGDSHTCKNGKCISLSWVCDGDDDCGDYSDELASLCPPKSCKSTEFSCNNKKCIQASWACDGDNDCGDNSDEEQSFCKQSTKANCTPLEFGCKTGNAGILGRCILKEWRCDGNRECIDGSDEEDCEKLIKCFPNEFKCKNGSCISLSKKCNMEVDCPDAEDEIGCAKFCGPDEFFCRHSKKCILESQVCDKRKDCDLGEDEPMSCDINECLDKNGHCNQFCVDKKIGYECKCKKGFQLESDGRTCEDTNECMIYGSCSQMCTNTKGSFVCSCLSSYVLDANQRTCKALGQPALLHYSNRHSINRVFTDGKNLRPVAKGLMSVIGITYHFATDKLYWTDSREKAINSALFSTSDNIVQVRKMGDRSNPDSVAIDWINQKLYWTDAGLDTIEVSELNGMYASVLVDTGLEDPRAIALDPTDHGRQLYWTDWGHNAKIERISMDGDPKTRQVVHSLNGSWPNGLSIDFTLLRLYWSDAKMKVIESSKLDGSDRRQIRYLPHHHPFSIVVFEDYMYWGDWINDIIYKANKFTSEGEPQEIVRDLTNLMGIDIYHPLRQPIARNPCEHNKHECSHLCLLSSVHGYSCRCPTGVKMLADRQTCNTTSAFTCSPYYCLNGGECINSTSKKLKNVRFCKCPRGFEGKRCGKRSSIPPLPTDRWHVTRPKTNNVAHEDLGETIGIVAGVVLCILAVAGVCIYLFYRNLRKNYRERKAINFDNPVYRRTTEDSLPIMDSSYDGGLLLEDTQEDQL